MRVPDWIRRELKVIDRDYFAVFNDKQMQWEIRWKRPDGSSKILLMADGYRELANDSMIALRRAMWNAQHIFEVIEEIDRHNARLDAQNEAEDDYQHRAAARSIWNYYQVPKVF